MLYALAIIGISFCAASTWTFQKTASFKLSPKAPDCSVNVVESLPGKDNEFQELGVLSGGEVAKRADLRDAVRRLVCDAGGEFVVAATEPVKRAVVYRKIVWGKGGVGPGINPPK